MHALHSSFHTDITGQLRRVFPQDHQEFAIGSGRLSRCLPQDMLELQWDSNFKLFLILSKGTHPLSNSGRAKVDAPSGHLCRERWSTSLTIRFNLDSLQSLQLYRPPRYINILKPCGSTTDETRKIGRPPERCRDKDEIHWNIMGIKSSQVMIRNHGEWRKTVLAASVHKGIERSSSSVSSSSSSRGRGRRSLLVSMEYTF